MKPTAALLLFALVGAASSCAEAGPRLEITERRTASRPSLPVLPGATAAQRFRSMAGPSASEREPSDDLIAYDLPEGWREQPPTQDRIVHLSPANDPEASCYLSFLQGNAGGLEANVNRWRKQVGAEPMTGSQVAALPLHSLLGRDATLVEVEGTFTGMGQAPRAGFSLLGLVVSEPGGSLFLKFTGPSPLVAAERERFLALAASLRLADSHGQQPDAVTGHPSHEPSLQWKAPEGWIEEPPRSMREVTFVMGEGAECYISRLMGESGGLRPNLDRWSRQLGGDGLTEEAFSALERVEVLGQSVPVLEATGTFTGMDGVERAEQGLLAVALIRPDESLFIKLTGPEGLVHAERGRFLEFVRSLEETH